MKAAATQISGGLRALNAWCEQIGVNQITAWRWRKKGWLTTINIAGRQYVSDEAIAEFHRRAAAGEFAAEHKVPVAPFAKQTVEVGQ